MSSNQPYARKATTRSPVAALVAALALGGLLSAGPALADHWHDRDYGHHRHHRPHHTPHHTVVVPGRGYVVERPVVVRPRPYYVAPAPVVVAPPRPSLQIVVPLNLR
ncbi:MAG: hypothetical protein GC191_10510 [Azospirillum sp.]|nr:hypothetical protein [Azospirillum sp.]